MPQSDDYVLIDADYSQIELRLMAAMSGDENMIETYREGKDIHTSTASQVFGVPEDEVTSDLRKKAKAVNFGIIYRHFRLFACRRYSRFAQGSRRLYPVVFCKVSESEGISR